MDINETTNSKKPSIKSKIYILLILILIGGGTYLYFWYQSTNNIRIQAQEVVSNAESFNILSDGIKKESNRCKDFIVGKEGDFGGFEYCKKFIEWSDSLMLGK